ncbi:MAG: EF-Tu/IF-2/RF-3 family GTPase [Candidatus Altiarchaeota archaeon]|nr:EF-Tu/IF-2/RF-3 family GTPase [Candidatus Altiarchaeota archaeon]
MSLTGNVTAVLGGGLAPSLGKKGTVSDVTLYNHKTGDCVLSFVEPSGYPEKVQPLVSSLNMADQVVLRIGEVNSYLAETIVALDAAQIGAGLVVLGDGISEDVFKSLIKDSIISTYPVVENQVVLLRERLARPNFDRPGEAIILVDHSFPVRGVGTVALGVVKRGVIRKHDEVLLYPGKQKTIVKSIQVHDTDVPEAVTGVRVGLAMKDVSPEDLPRGTIISTDDGIPSAREIEVSASVSRYAPRSVGIGDVFMANSSLNYINARVEGGSLSPGESGVIRLSLEKELALVGGRVLLLDPGQRMPRVFGGGQLPE